MLCMSRITDEKLKQYFGNGVNSFYIELRCNLPCVSGSDACDKCQTKVAPYKYQGSRRYDHGKVNEPISDHSHIFGSKWYESRLLQWGQPSSDTIRVAFEYQKEARNGFIVYQNNSNDTSKGTPHTENQDQDMPRGRKPKAITDEGADADASGQPVTTRKRKPRVATTVANTSNNDVSEQINETNNTTEVATKQPRKRKQAVSNDSSTNDAVVPPKKTVGKKRSTPVQKPVATTNPLITGENIVHQDAVIPTFMENDMEQVDTDGYEIEYVELRNFELNGTAYFRDYKKDKLYKKIKGGIGPYIGRYSRDLDEIDSTIPDSDDETE
jgi:hypothetical protein